MSIATKISPEVSKAITENMRKVFESYSKYFGIPNGDAFFVRLNQNSTYKKGNIEGGVFGQSIVIGANIATYNEKNYGLYLVSAHELGHLWNPNVLKNENVEALYWFSEGFTDYYTKLIMRELKIIEDDETLLVELKKFAKEYSTLQSDLSLQEAGKFKSKNYPHIYSGGSMVALNWDISIREITKNKNSLWHLMDPLYKNARSGKLLNLAMIQSELEKLVGKEKSIELMKLTSNKEKFNVNIALNKIGYHFKLKQDWLDKVDSSKKITLTDLINIKP